MAQRPLSHRNPIAWVNSYIVSDLNTSPTRMDTFLDKRVGVLISRVVGRIDGGFARRFLNNL